MISEADSRTMIDLQLRNLGWKFLDGATNSHEQQVYCEIPKERHRKLLGALRPDYTLYKSNSDEILAVVEAKRAGGDFDSAWRDGIRKAELLNCKIVFVSDGVSTFARHLGFSQKPLIRNGDVVCDFLTEIELIDYQRRRSINSESAIKSKGQLISVFKTADNILKDEGISQGLPRLFEFCNVLFLKILFDIEKHEKSYAGARPEYNWESLKEREGADLLDSFSQVIRRYNETYQGVFEKIGMSHVALKRVINLIDDVGNLADVNTDIKGEAFEYFLRSYSDTHSDLAQYFTPRHAVRFLIDMANPQLGQTIYDPFCGTGGMLIEAFKHVHKNSDMSIRENVNRLCLRTVFGQDNTQSARIAKMNMILAGDGHNNITRENTFEKRDGKKHDLIITNIPFNLKHNNRDANGLAIEHCLNSLKPDGRAFMIVPSTIVNGDMYTSLRKNILKNVVERVVELPRKLFVGYTKAKTYILVMSNHRSSQTIFYNSVVDDGFLDGVRREPHHKGSDFNRIMSEERAWTEITPTAPSYFLEIEKKKTGVSSSLYSMAKLRDLVTPRTEKTVLDDDAEYDEPKITKNHQVTTKQRRLGRNIGSAKDRLRVIAQPGDIIFSTLHTQNGLFAKADREYVLASQMCCTVNTGSVEFDYLWYMLDKVVPTLQNDDLTGRETYKPDEILDLDIPLPPLEKQQEMLRAIRLKESELETAQQDLSKAKDAMFAGIEIVYPSE